VEDFWKRRTADITTLVANLENRQNIIAITHNPDTFDFLPPEVPLLVAGHTHGGQVYLPFIGAPAPVAKREYTYGLYERDGRYVYTTAGFGVTGPPIRFAAPPEIAVLTLQAK
jgi:uncharacterized protein